MSEFEKVFGEGRPLPHDPEDYWRGVSGDGDLGYQWEDKPHRLVFDLIAGVLHERRKSAILREALERIVVETDYSYDRNAINIARDALARAKGEEPDFSEEDRYVYDDALPVPKPRSKSEERRIAIQEERTTAIATTGLSHPVDMPPDPPTTMTTGEDTDEGTCETCRWADDPKADECYQCSMMDRQTMWAPRAGKGEAE